MGAAVDGDDLVKPLDPAACHEPRIQFAGIMPGIDEVFTRRDDVPPCGQLADFLAVIRRTCSTGRDRRPPQLPPELCKFQGDADPGL
jgi:hypothetical protein